ncbi:MAG: hypothetical protein AMJ53_16110 [Gammaproteobacteria bacterium SG8_11]|nr:MAG: hypothetical protein AMJ53_16110 [Gammaproteobacteria bacterium SG8_11]
MKDLRNSFLLLLFYIIAVLGITQIQYVEYNFVDFEPAFFILFALAAASGVLLAKRFRPSIYVFLAFWAGVYGLIWLSIWRGSELTTQVLVLQLILIEISAGLSYFVGLHVDEVESILDELSESAYPNRVLEIDEAGERINVEITRSRRYNRPLIVLVVQLQEILKKGSLHKFEKIQKDLLTRFAMAKAGQIISETVRQTDLIVRDRTGEFVIICPETDFDTSNTLVERIQRGIEETMGCAVELGSASFPDESLAFDELLQKAKRRLGNLNAIPLADKNIVDIKK